MSKAREWHRGWQMPGPLGSAKFANAPPLGLTRRASALQLPGGGGGCWVQVESTDALSVTGINAIDLLMVLEAKHDS